MLEQCSLGTWRAPLGRLVCALCAWSLAPSALAARFASLQLFACAGYLVCSLAHTSISIIGVGDVWLGLLPALSLIKDYASPILGFEKHVS